MLRLVGGGGSLKLIRTVTKSWPEGEWPVGKNGSEGAAQTVWKCG